MKFIRLCSPALLLTAPIHAEDLSETSWPKTFETSAYEIALYQPQVQEWQDFKLAKVSLAVGIKTKDGDKQTFGALNVEAPTVADFEERVVHFGDRKVTMIRFPEASDPEL